MPRVAVTGHVNVSEETARWVIEALTARLQDVVGPGWHGVTCLAGGADQLFAKVVLALKGKYDVVLPAADYEQQMLLDGDGEPFGALLAEASEVETMPYPTSSRAAYLAASVEMLRGCDQLLAVWDGEPSRAVGDTADVVQRAKALQIPVIRVWPPESLVTRVAARGLG
jgi:hypothetical protein